MRGVQSSANKLLILRSQGVIYVSSQNFWNRCRIGNREVVGFGMNGEYEYCDRMDFPYPAIRFREFKGDDLKLKEKEKGDWKKLTADEKKAREYQLCEISRCTNWFNLSDAVYRISFCRTFAEMQAPTGEWKTLLGTTLVFVTLGVWMMVLMKKFGVYIHIWNILWIFILMYELMLIPHVMTY